MFDGVKPAGATVCVPTAERFCLKTRLSFALTALRLSHDMRMPALEAPVSPRASGCGHGR